ncbi:MAG: PHP domain-containing protein [Cyclobacteriaceae bacterium]|nr:PHP domain-containing protein [Cyclobacteriaceae bacterium]
MNFLKNFPSKEVLLKQPGGHVFDLNGHIHTPYSFSAFDDIPQIFRMANEEGIKAVGINDFIVTDGYKAFHDQAIKAGVFPLFNIEFMGLLKQEQATGIRVNDPSNPGRTYFSGKGLDYPNNPDEETRKLLQRVKEESNRQTEQMIEKLDQFMDSIDAPFGFSFNEIKKQYAQDLVRERHIAKAVRRKVFSRFLTDDERIQMLTKIFSGKKVESPIDDISALENEIRGRLLKAGCPAFVPEDDSAFLEIKKVMEVIVAMGGIPCYPVLLDDKKGTFTEYESDFYKLRDNLKAMNIHCIELIPGRNDMGILKKFVSVFHEDDFVITFGTEHNTPELIPLKVDTRGHIDLDEELKEISWMGACVIAAHQYLRANGGDGYVDRSGKVKKDQITEFRNLGAAVFNYYFSK